MQGDDAPPLRKIDATGISKNVSYILWIVGITNQHKCYNRIS